MARRIAIGGIHTECSTYSPHIARREDFRITEGAALLAKVGFDFAAHDIDAVPLFHAAALPGGPVEQATYQDFKRAFLAALDEAGPLDGVLLVMHGAMYVDGMTDAEGNWIGAVRQKVDDGPLIAVSYDLHGNVSQPIVDSIDIFAAYRTAPHIDVAATHQRAAAMLTAALSGGPRPSVAWAPVPVLLPGERTSTEDEPTASIYRRLPDFDQREGVHDANMMVGYVWADEPRATAAAVVTGTDRAAMEQAAAEIATDYWSHRAGFDFGMPTGSIDAMLAKALASPTRPVILADSGDNPTGGGVGDRADVLAALLDRRPANVLVAGIADPDAAIAAAEAGVGARLEITLGGGFGSDCQRVTIAVEVRKVTGSVEERDLQVLVAADGVRIVVTWARRPFHHVSDFEALGEDLASLDLLVVKSGYLSPELAPLASPGLMALSDGAVNQDIPRLSSTRRVRPVYPFDSETEWRAAPVTSARAIVD